MPTTKDTKDTATAPAFTIRQFSQRKTCYGAFALKDTLLRDFADQSVSIQFTKPTGIQAVIYVDVRDGAVVESYGAQAPVDFDALDAFATPAVTVGATGIEATTP